MGNGGVLVLRMREKGAPVVTAKLPTREVGRVHDAAAIGGRIFLLGERGLQMMNSNATRMAESIDVVDAQARAANMGRHIVSIGSNRLQIVDSTPLTGRAAPADVAP